MTLKLAIIGTGIKARQYIDAWSRRPDVELVAIADPSEAALIAAAGAASAGQSQAITSFSEWKQMLSDAPAKIDAVYISTPHAFHGVQAVAALEAGHDVLLEKPMVMNADEAERVIDAERKSGKTLVVAYQGGLSPLVQQLRRDVRDRVHGELVSINAAIWENWSSNYEGHWKQNVRISGGGFMFDTGAHLLNTVSLICDSDVERLAAFVDKRGYPVDSVTAVSGRLSDGTPFTMNAAGDTVPVCESRIELFFTQAIVRVCAWGRWIEIERPGKAVEREEQESANNLMDVFQKVRSGEISNPSTAEQGLKLAGIWDAIKRSAESRQIAVMPRRPAS